jgi:precorrin-6A synthase
MIDLTLVGIGAGHPDHLTRQGERALNAADLILIPEKGAAKADLADLRRAICAAVVTNPATRLAGFAMPERCSADPDYESAVNQWHDAIAEVWHATIAAHLPQGGRVALLVWGDPSLYDSTLRIAARLSQRMALRISVVPGITALQALTAAHATALNTIGAPVVITTGRRLRAEGWPPGADAVAVMLDGNCAFQTLDPDGITIWWGACLGMPEQIIEAGPLAEAAPRILARREAARQAHGWIMDIYLMHRRAG